MTKFLALLRGINVGGRVVKMVDLKTCFEKMGFADVKTILQTGNVVFENDLKEPELKKKIEEVLTKTFNYPAKVQVIEVNSLKKIIDSYPFDVAGVNQHDYVIFIENGLEKDLVTEEYALAAGEKVKMGNRAVCWRVDKGQTLKSSFAKILTKAKYKEFNTVRNIKTLKKIVG